MSNSIQPQPIKNIENFDQINYPSYESIGSEYYISASREVSGASGERNAPAIDIELFDKQNGNSLGRIFYGAILILLIKFGICQT